MIKVGISGKIASGKSQVESIIENLGYKVFDLDKISHSLFDDENIQKKLLDEFKTLDRKEIGKIVFSDVEKKNALEKIIHPELKNIIFNLFEQNKEEKAIFISGALIFKTGFYKFFDKTIFVEANEQTRLERLMKRNKLTFNEAQARLNLQDDNELADFIVENNSSFENLETKTIDLIKSIVNQ